MTEPPTPPAPPRATTATDLEGEFEMLSSIDLATMTMDALAELYVRLDILLMRTDEPLSQKIREYALRVSTRVDALSEAAATSAASRKAASAQVIQPDSADTDPTPAAATSAARSKA